MWRAAVAVTCIVVGCGQAPAGTSEVADASDRADAGGAFCAHHADALGCEDFDSARGVGPAWTTFDGSGRNDSELVAVPDAPSQPRVLSLYVPRDEVPSGVKHWTQAGLALRTTFSRVTIAFDMRISQVDRLDYAKLVNVVTTSSPPAVIQVRTTGEVVQRVARDGSYVDEVAATLVPELGRWMHFALGLDLEGHTGWVAIGDSRRDFALDRSWTPSMAIASIGLDDAPTDAAWQVDLDDVLVTSP